MSCKKNKLNRKMNTIINNVLKQQEQLLLYGESFTDEKGNVIPIEEWHLYENLMGIKNNEKR